MTAPDDKLSTQYSALWDEWLDDAGDAPDVFGFLAKHNVADEGVLSILLVDQFRRWQSGKEIPVEEYAERCPFLAASPEELLELILEELGHLEERAGSVDREAFADRFRHLPPSVLSELRAELDGVRDVSDASASGVSVYDSLIDNEQPGQFATPGEETVPEIIGRYSVQRILGQGSFGVVYLARDSELDREVAVKVPSLEGLSRAGGVDAFLREAKMVAQLEHPGIVPVYDFGRTDDGQCFTVSRFINGTNLAERRKNLKLSRNEIVELICSIGTALHAAHQRGLVHRDVKPANILLDEKNHPHIVDFGLALSDQDFGTGLDFVGTPAYMSPEQARGEGHRVDARSDVYSLGVILYELLTGRRPHRSSSTKELLHEIVTGDVRPPRQLNDSVPRELDRICLKALSSRVVDRYSTAADFVEELRTFLAESTLEESPGRSGVLASSRFLSTETNVGSSLDGSSISGSSAISNPGIRIVPKGLRSFDSGDAEFFHELLPGPRDRKGLPDNIRFWKHRIETTSADDSFSVGLIYGPSGCGKSSFVKAGLLPALSDAVNAIFVDATADDTETRILAGLRKASGLDSSRTIEEDLQRNSTGYSPVDLTTHLAELRRSTRNDGNKTVIFIDQFEQWLYGAKDRSRLVNALRQCDGRRVQAVVMVRDDFWMALTRFMRELEVPLVEGSNSAAVDLFDERHARRVLTAFGRAFGALPETPLSKPNEQFIKQAVRGIAENGKVVCVRLAVFAEMMKGRPWQPETLASIGGIQRIGEVFLDETFGSSAPQRLRIHAAGARAVLQRLMPESGTDIKAGMQSIQELRNAAGQACSDESFRELLQVLDGELKLITPTEPHQLAVGIESEDSGRRGHGPETSESAAHSTTALNRHRADSQVQRSYFQLAHDFLVPALRQWLTQAQRATLRGRTALQLESQANDWNAQPEARRLPSLVEYVSAQLLTNHGSWSQKQRRMMNAASGFHLRRLILLSVLVLCGWVAGREINGRTKARAFEQRLLAARLAKVPEIIEELEPYRNWVEPRLQRTLAELSAKDGGDSSDSAKLTERHELAIRMALLDGRPNQLAALRDILLHSQEPEFSTILEALKPYQIQLRDSLWQVVTDPPPELVHSRLQAVAALAHFHSDSNRWPELADDVTDDLVTLRPVLLDSWLEQVAPIGTHLLDSMTAVFHDADALPKHRLAAAEALSRFAADRPERLFSLIIAATDQQFSPLSSSVKHHKEAAIDYFQRELKRDPLAWPWPDMQADWVDVPPEIQELIQTDRGILTDRVICVVQQPYDERFHELCDELSNSGFRPIRIRPYTFDDGLLVAAIFHRDGGVWKTAVSLSANELLRKHREMTAEGFLAADVAGFSVGDEIRYSALWEKRPPRSTATTTLKLGLTDSEFQELLNPGQTAIPITRYSFLDQQLGVRHCVIMKTEKDFDDRWVTLECAYDEYLERRYVGRRQLDVSLYPTPGLENPRTVDYLIAGLWLRDDETVYTRHLPCANVNSHGDSLKVVINREGFVPVSICGTQLGRSNIPSISSIFHRRFQTWRGNNEYLRRRANAAMALLLAGQSSVFDELKSSADPTLRTFLIDHLTSPDVPIEFVLDRLESEEDSSIRFALLTCLSERLRRTISKSTLDRILKYAQTAFEEDPDPGIHSISERLLRNLGDGEWMRTTGQQLHDVDLSQFQADQTWSETLEHRNWIHGHNGHVLAVIDAGEFPMGYRPTDEFRNASALQHVRKINRRFAIATKEISVEQFGQFQKTHPELREREGEVGIRRGGPQVYMSFYVAAQYCNWLNAQADIPKDQWCYAPNEEGRYHHGMKILPNIDGRSGYRLPTEAEWEYACRAGTETMFYFGEAIDLLPKYAWYAGNSDHRPHPIGSLRPNDFGLFDMLGNGLEITQTPYLYRYVGRVGDELPEVIHDNVDEFTFESDSEVSARGSGYMYENYVITSPRRLPYIGGARSHAGTIRVVRTLPKK